MRLTLHYRGSLYANGTPTHKHELRQAFHTQLRTLWAQKPLVDRTMLLAPGKADDEYSLLRPMGGFTFVPLVNVAMDSIAELSLTLLRPEAPGNLLTQGGDIDNRLKTLFDALSMPRHANALPRGASPSQDETPFYCLLEDDNLVTAVQVRTEQLLEPISESSLVDLFIFVRTRVTRPTIGNDFLS